MICYNSCQEFHTRPTLGVDREMDERDLIELPCRTIIIIPINGR